MTAGTIAILDDEPDRLKAMVPILNKRYPALKVVTFDNAPDINSGLRTTCSRALLFVLIMILDPIVNVTARILILESVAMSQTTLPREIQFVP